MNALALIIWAAAIAATACADGSAEDSRDWRAGVTRADRPDGPRDIRGVVGILATPAIALECTPEHRAWRPQDAADCPELSLPLRARPHADAPVTAILDLDNYPFTHEYDYEALGVLVYGEVEGWRRVRSEASSGWLSPDHVTGFVEYPDRVVDHLAHFNDWDGVVYDAPAGDAASLLSDAGREAVLETGANVAAQESATIDGELWFRVTIFGSSQCEGEPAPLLEDVWVPGFQADGANTLWFYSRGC